MQKELLGGLLAAMLVCSGPGWGEPKKPTNLAGLVYTTATRNHPTDAGYDAVAGAEVVLEGTSYQATADRKGMFEFKGVPDGDYTMVVRRDGFVTVTKAVKVEGGTFPTTLQLVMNPIGTMMVGDTPVGRGTVFVAFAARTGPVTQEQQTAIEHLDREGVLRNAIAVGADPLALESNAPPDFNQGPSAELNPVTTTPNTLMMYPPATPMKTGFQSMSSQPYWLCFDQAGTTLYLSNADQQIELFDVAHGQKLLRTYPAQGFVTDLALSPDGRFLMAAVLAANPFVSLLDTRTQELVAQIPCPTTHGHLPCMPQAVAMSRNGTRLFVALSSSSYGEVTAFNPQDGQCLGSCPVGANPTGMALSADGQLLFVANSSSASLSVVNPLSLVEITRIPVGVGPHEVAVSPDGKRVFVSNRHSGTVSVIDARALAVIATPQVGAGPLGMAVSQDSHKLFVTCKDAGTVVTLDAETGAVLHKTVPLPRSSPYGVAIQP